MLTGSGEADVDDDDAHDPFAAFDAATGAGTVRDPYPALAERRRRCPVHPVASGALGGEDSYEVLSYELVSAVLRDDVTFSSRCYADLIGPLIGHSILEMDEPEHRRYRGLIQQAFTRRSMQRWEAEIVRPTVHGLIERFATRGRADLVRELTFPFPVEVIAGMLGLPAEDLGKFHRWAVELIGITVDWDRGMTASAKLRDYFAEVLSVRRAEPREDLISLLAGAELDGDRLDDEEIFAFLRLLLPAGAETTYRSSSNMLFALLTNPDQLEAVRHHRELVDAAVEEAVRWEPPLLGILRRTTADVDLAGVPMPAGALVNVRLGAANRDDTRWEDPDRFDLGRQPRPHAGFALGPHSCLGMHLARMEMSVVLQAVLDRLAGLRLDPEASDVHITGEGFRAPSSLPVVFEPA